MTLIVKCSKEGPGGELSFVVGETDEINAKPIRAMDILDPRVDMHPINTKFYFLRRGLVYFDKDYPSIECVITRHDIAVTSIPIRVYKANRGEETEIVDILFNLESDNSEWWIIEGLLDELRKESYAAFNPETFVEPFLQEPVFEQRHQGDVKLLLPASEYLHTFITSAPKGRFHLIASPSGTGKTTLFRYFQHVMLEPGELNKPLAAIWVDADVLVGMTNVSDDVIIDAIVKHYKVKIAGINADVLRMMLAAHDGILLVDGLDEIVSGAGRGSLKAWLDAIAGLAIHLDAKVLVSCRGTLFTSTGGLARFAPRVHEIASWDRTLMLTWVERNAKTLDPPVEDEPQRILNTIEFIQPLKELCKVPFLLKSFVEIYPSLPDNILSIKKHEIYERFVTKKLETRLSDIPLDLTLELLKKLVQLIAFVYLVGKEKCLMVDGAMLAGMVKDNVLFSSTEQQFIKELADSKSGIKDLEHYVRACSLLEASHGGCVFPHRSIAEYLVADLIASSVSTRDVYFLGANFTPEAMDLLLEMLGESNYLTVEEILHFFSADCDGATCNRLIRWMKKGLKENLYTMQDIGRVVTEGLINQVDIDCTRITILQEPFAFTSLGGAANEMTTLLDLILRNDQIKKLNLEGCKLSSFPETSGNLKSLQTLYLTDNQLTYLPDTIGKLIALEELDLSNNKFTFLPETIGQLTALQKLWIDRNKLSSLPETIGNLNSLQILDLWCNQLSSLPDTINNFVVLKKLKLHDNKLSSLPEQIGELFSLRELDLSDNHLSSLPDTIGKLASLEELHLSNNQLSSLPRTIGKLASLEELHLSNNQLSSLPRTIGNLKSLEDLRLGGNTISSLTETIGKLKSLRFLELSDNQLISLPNTIGSLVALQGLDLNNNSLSLLPERIGELSSLRELELSDNHLSSLPDTIGKLASLEELNLKKNKLLSLPDSIGNLQFLKILDLWGNQLTSLPITMGQLTSLEKLILIDNQIYFLPDTIGELRSLKELMLVKNQLSSLPSTIGQLTLLQELWLGGNHLSSLPDTIKNLISLTNLGLYSNNLTTFPEAIINLNSLASLGLNHNQLSSIPDSIVNLNSLTSLELSDNKLSSLPETIVNLNSLTYLDLSQNRFSSLSVSIEKWIKNLENQGCEVKR